MHRWIVVASALGAAACVSIPEFNPDIAVRWDDATTSARGSNFVLQFGQDKVRFPTSLTVNGSTFVLGHSSEPALQCNTEDQAGIALYPTARISPTNTAADSTLDPAMYGPAVVKANLHWTSSFDCADSVSRSLAGFTSITVFPDGRIVRYDSLADAGVGQAQATPMACSCTGNNENEWHVTTFWSVFRTPFQQLRSSDATATLDNGIQSTGPICLEGTPSLTYAKRLGTPTLPDTRTNNPASDTIALVQDMYEGPALAPLPQPVSANTVLQVGAECSIPTATLWQMTGGLANNGAPIPFANDGIYGGDNDGNGGGYNASGTVVLSGTVMTSFAVWLAFESRTDSLRITRENHAPGTWNIPQALNEDKTNWVIWFRDGFASGDTITIEPQAP